MNGDVIIQRVCEHRLVLKEASVFDFRFHDSKFQSIRAIDFRVVRPNFVSSLGGLGKSLRVSKWSL